MSEEEVQIYRYNDDVSFRICTLKDKTSSLTNGDCTCFYTREENWRNHFYCEQYGIHLHCTKHPERELEYNKGYGRYLKCEKCDNQIEVDNFDILLQNCLKILNMPKFKDAKLIRLDDWYIPEIKERIEIESDYWIKAEVKTDKDKDTMIVLYIGNKDSKKKSQFFIKPEKLQLSSDHKDLDPATIISKIEVTLKDRRLMHKYENEED